MTLNERARSEPTEDTSIAEGLWLLPSARLWKLRFCEGGAVAVVLIAIGAVAAFVGGGGSTGVITTICIVTFCALFLVALRRRVQAWRYRERDDDLIVSRGLLVQRLSVVPYGRMQFVDVTAGPFERIFHIATVRLHTAAAASDARIPGLETDEAARLRDRLASLGESKAAGI